MKKVKKIISSFLIIFVFFVGILVVNATSNTLINIDYPKQDENLTNELYIQGWIMSEDTDVNLEIYLDNKMLDEDVIRSKRSDVIAAIKGYGDSSTNPTPGYQLTVDLNDYNYGTHTIKVMAKNASGNTLTEETREFIKAAPASDITIDLPANNSEAVDSVYLAGWTMSEASNNSIRVTVDDNDVTESIERHERSDVIAAIKGYGDSSTNPTPGFRGTINLSHYDYGKHTIKIELLDSSNRVLKEKSVTINKKAPASDITIDLPANNSEAVDSVYLAGWTMSEASNNSIRVTVDDNDVTESIERHERSDVIAAIKGYGDSSTNPTPGFRGTIDLSHYDYGKHNIKIELLDSSNRVLKEKSVVITKRAPKTLINIDYPKLDEEKVNQLKIQGWIMSEYDNPTLEVYLDGEKLEGVIRSKRSDVIAAIKGYGDSSTNPTPGYQLTVDLNYYSYGTHTVKIIAKDDLGNTLSEETREFINKKPNTMVTIDNPTNNSNRSLLISGWVMSETANKTVKVYLDEEEIATPAIDDKRSDVLNAIKGYGDITTNPTPGFSTTYDLTNYKDGNHTIKIEVISSNGEVIATKSKTFTLEKYKSNINITTPTNSTYKNSIDISGYALSEAPSFSLDLYIDNTLIAENINRTNDGNISSSLLEEYGSSNTLPNYKYTYDVTNLTDGTHTLSVKLKLADGEVIETKQASFKVKKYESAITIDYPNSQNINRKESLFVRGWVMSEDINSTVRVFIDNNEIKESVSRFEREDVLNAINGYGGRETNPTPGYEVTTDLSNLTVGYHTLSIKIYDHLNEVINTQNITLYVYDGFEHGIDVSQFNGNINWTAVKNSGGVDFAMIRCGYRGYGTGVMVMDTKFSENFTNAVNNNIKAGIYFFSQATTYLEGAAEANFIIEAINMTPGAIGNIEMPLVLDVESSTEGHGNGRADKLTVAQRTDAVKGFIDQMNKYGYKPMIYANKDYLTNKMDISKWTNYDVWLAHWTYDFNKRSDYKGTYTMWQYSDVGTVNGINGSVDLNIAY